MPQQERRGRGQVEAANPATGPQRLEVLSANPALRNIVAGNPNAPARLLDRLARDQDSQVRQTVASNPNTAWKTLEELAWEFPREFLSNPVGPLQILAHPEQLRTDEAFWGALLREATIPNLWWNWIKSYLTHPILGLARPLRMHVQYAGETEYWYGLPHGEDDYILSILVDLFSVASAQGAVLPASSDDKHLNIPGEQVISEHLQRLARNKNLVVRRAVARSELTPLETLSALAQDEEGTVRVAAASNERTPVKMLQMLAQDQDVRVLRMVARNPQTPGEVLSTLAHEKDISVRQAVASHPQTPIEVLSTLVQDTEVGVRKQARQVLRRLKNPKKWLQKLEQEQELSRQSFLEKPYPKGMGDWSIEMQLGFILSLDFPEPIHQTIIATFAADWNTHIIWTSFAAMEQERLEEGISPRRDTFRLIMTPSMPPIALQRMAVSPYWEMRYLVALHKKIPQETRLLLSQDGNRYVRAMAQARTGCSIH